MKRISVDIGGTFTDCFVAWGERFVQAKALTTHQNLALGFNEALAEAGRELNVDLSDMLRQVDSVRYATTLGTWRELRAMAWDWTRISKWTCPTRSAPIHSCQSR